jgi:hypothetical protein
VVKVLRPALNEGTLRAFRNADRFPTFKIFRRAAAFRRRLLFFSSFRGGRSVTLLRMSAQEIIAELAKLKPEELRLVKEKLDRLNAKSPMPQTGWGRALSEMAGKADDLPADLSLQHDHYLYGTPKR